MDQPEQSGDQPPPPQVGANDVFQRHVHDRCGDSRLDEGWEPRACGREVVRRAKQREGVRYREGGYNRNYVADATEGDDETEKKQKVVDPAKDVSDSKYNESCDRTIPSGVEKDPPGPTGDQHRSILPVERQ